VARLLFSEGVETRRRRRLEYAFRELLRLAGVLAPDGETSVGYGAEGTITIEPSPADNPAGAPLRLVGDASEHPGWPQELFSLFAGPDARLPGSPLYADGSGRALITINDDRIHLAADPLATAWYLLGQEEERRFPDRRDEHGRLCLGVTELPPKTFERPWLEAWGRFFATSLARSGPVVRYDRHPGGAGWSVVLTHDVDSLGERSLGRALRLAAGGVLKFSRAHLRAAGRMLRLLGGPDRHRRLEMCVEADAPQRATYLFHAGRRGRWDPEYRLSRHRRETELLREDGQELGIHYGYETAGNLSRLENELADFKRATGVEPRGGRAHYLHLRGPGDLGVVTRAGLLYDSSLGLADGPGFRVGTGGPYRFFDHVSGELTSLFELPLIVMDGALFKEYGEGAVDVEDAWNRVRPYLDAAREVRAAVCLLWHQRVFGPAYPGWGEVYGEIITYARENGAWTGPAIALIEHALAAERLFVEGGFVANKSNKAINITVSSNPGRTVTLHPGESHPLS
jgi:hypothetical protein